MLVFQRWRDSNGRHKSNLAHIHTHTHVPLTLLPIQQLAHTMHACTPDRERVRVVALVQPDLVQVALRRDAV